MLKVHENDLDFDQDDYLFYYKGERFKGIHYQTYSKYSMLASYFYGEELKYDFKTITIMSTI